ncbi:heme-binding protein [Methylomonas sp. AM2-LC]|uniref:SOUL family heme-binding protein n=1 Tax=Methylomonas sp. AM2-LC TaxID=3153301 RepID=UPI0032632796
MGIRTSEEAPFTLISQQGDIQIRQYPAIVVAETEVEANYASSGSIGFNRLAGYIFGNNIQNQKMAMTTPVFRENAGEKMDMTAPVFQQAVDNKWLMSFVMPSGYDLTNLPTPLDKQVVLKETPTKKVAVLRYSGSLTVERIAEQSQILSDWLTEHHYRQLSKPRSAAFDPPWTLPALRRNEIHIEIE